MRTIKKMMDEYAALSEHKRHEVWEIMEKYYKDLDESDKQEMGYELAVVVYGECLSEHEARHIVSEMYGHCESGEHWTIDEIKSLAQSKGINFDKEHYSCGDLYAMMHAMYYDHYDFISMMTSDSGKIAEYSFKLAHGFLDDEDAPEHGKGKARKYFHFVV